MVPPPWAFLKGVVLGAVVGVPTVGLTVWLLGHAGLGARDRALTATIQTAAIFAGVATVLTAGGVGRLAAHASVTGRGGRRRATLVAGRAFAAAGAGLVLIAQIPGGQLPSEPWRWAMSAGAGAVAGAVVGVVLGLACGGRAPVPAPAPPVTPTAARAADGGDGG
ncbi:MAG: hypothetical protein R2939_14210 [Kofleriaceae bacterium]